MKPLHVFEIKPGDLPSHYFLVDQETQSAIWLEKEESHIDYRRGWIYFHLDDTQTGYGMRYDTTRTIPSILSYLLLREISRQVGFEVKNFVGNHFTGRSIFGKRFDDFIAAHRGEVYKH